MHELLPRAGVEAARVPVHEIADALDRLHVGPLIVGTDIVRFARRAILQHAEERIGMGFHVQPVVHIFAVATNWNWVVLQSFQDCQGYEFLRIPISP